jgi:alpha-amylase
VSPPQEYNRSVDKWYKRYQPVDFFRFGDLGTKEEFRSMCQTAKRHGIAIWVDVVFNHMTSVDDPPGYIKMEGDEVVSTTLPQFLPKHFNPRRRIEDVGEIKGWLFYGLADLNTEDPYVRSVAKEYLKLLVELGASGFRFDAAKHIEPDFFPEVLSVVPNTFSFAEIAEGTPAAFSDMLKIKDMYFYDFPLVTIMKDAFADGGDLTTLLSAHKEGKSLQGNRAITFVRNHDIDRGQSRDSKGEFTDGGFNDPESRSLFGVGWSESKKSLNRDDVVLAHAFILGWGEGIPYVFVDMPGDSDDCKDDRFDDPRIIIAIRFHNLCLQENDQVEFRKALPIISEKSVIGWQRGRDRFIVINKSTDSVTLSAIKTSLKAGVYKDIQSGKDIMVPQNGEIARANFPARSAAMYVWISDQPQ